MGSENENSRTSTEDEQHSSRSKAATKKLKKLFSMSIVQAVLVYKYLLKHILIRVLNQFIIVDEIYI